MTSQSEHSWRDHYAIGCNTRDCPICIRNDLTWCDICDCWVRHEKRVRKLRLP